jgi:four helix bundle protein
MTKFIALELSLDVIRALRSALLRLKEADSDLARQLRRALASAALNLGEGRRRRGADRKYHYSVAAGSADESVTCLRVAEAFGYLALAEVEDALAILDRVLAILWRLTQ